MDWEMINLLNYRARVFGGWVLKTYEPVVHDRGEQRQGMIDGWNRRVSTCFIPDPKHEWNYLMDYK